MQRTGRFQACGGGSLHLVMPIGYIYFSMAFASVVDSAQDRSANQKRTNGLTVR